MDAERKRAELRRKKNRNQSIAVGVSAPMYAESELTKSQLLDISYGLSFLHCLGIMHGDLKGVRFGSSPLLSVNGDLQSPTTG